MAIVVDASVLLRWYFEDEEELAPGLFRRIVASTLTVPAHWAPELANGIVVGERRGRSQASQVAHLTALLGKLDIDIDHQGAEQVFTLILPLARTHH